MSQPEEISKSIETFFSDVTQKGLKPNELNDIYDNFAPLYDTWVKQNNHVVPMHAVKALEAVLAGRTDAKILDVCAGTGLVGEQLSAKGYINVDALDASAVMLMQAERKGIYKELIRDFLGANRLPIEDSTTFFPFY